MISLLEIKFQISREYRYASRKSKETNHEMTDYWIFGLVDDWGLVQGKLMKHVID